MKTVHFKRHGFADWLEMNIDNIYVEMHGLSIRITEEYKEEEKWQGKTYTITKDRTLLSKKYSSFNYEEIEKDINSVLQEKIKLDHFIESYGLQLKKDNVSQNDIDMLDGKIITDTMTLNDYPEALEILKSWYKKVSNEMIDTLKNNAMNTKIKDLFMFVHDNNYKQDFENSFKSLYS